MIDLVLAGVLAATASDGQPRPVIVCPGPDPRCPRAPSAPPVLYRDCPDGTRVSPGQSCPVAVAGSYVILFGEDDANLGDKARAVLDEVVNAYRSSGGGVRLTLSSHTDRFGSAEANVGLSERYANQVRDYLIASGVSPSAIMTQALGETRPAVDTPDGVREPENRRVEISLGPSEAW